MGKSETEDRILKAARCEFLSKGYEGTRMRSIAERADINKGLLHYYFKTKDALLVHVFQETFQELFLALELALGSKKDLFEKIEITVSVYTDFMIRHPELPAFIVLEMNRDPRSHSARMKKAGIETPMALFAKSMIEAKEQGIVKENINPGDVILNMISMILFPVVAKHMVKYMHNLNDVQYRQMIEDRKAVITQFIIQAIKA